MAAMYSVLCVVAFALNANCFLFDDDTTAQGEVSERCWTAMEVCSNKTLTTGRCKSTYGGFALDWMRNDLDANCGVNGTDFVPDVTRFYDTDNDGQMCGSEWEDRRTRYFGYSSAQTQAEWAILAGGTDCLPVAALAGAPTQSLKTDFSNNGVSRLVDFCNQGNNMDTDRGCLGLPVVCRDRRPDLEACRGLPDAPNTRSLMQKVNMVVSASDGNGDGVLTVEEDWAKYSTLVDTDGDGCISKAEFDARYVGVYGFSPATAWAVFNSLNGDVVSCMDRHDVERNVGAAGIQVDLLRSGFMDLLVAVCEHNTSLYHTNTDCAQVVDTCLQYFPAQSSCRTYLPCGVDMYQSCVRSLPVLGDCRRPEDKEEVRLEIERSYNQLLPGDQCTDYTTVADDEVDGPFSFGMFGPFGPNWLRRGGAGRRGGRGGKGGFGKSGKVIWRRSG